MRCSRKKSLAIAGIAVLLVVGWFLWQLFGPNPAIVVSKDTTFITAPLRPDGLPDYEKYLLEKMREEVTPENNAAVLFWQAMGPGEMSAREFELVAKEIGLEKLPTSEECLKPLDGEDNHSRVADWLREQYGDDVIASSEWTDADEFAVELLLQSMDRPWNSEQIPPLGEWVINNEPQFSLLIAALKRKQFYSPTPELLNDSCDSLLYISHGVVQQSRSAAKSLSARAMWHLGEERHADAWSDLLAVYRLSRLVAQGPTLIDQLASVAIEAVANRATLALLSYPNLPSDIVEQIHKDLLSIKPRNKMIRCLEFTERSGALSAILNLSSGNVRELDLDDSVGKVATTVTVDWNIPLREMNLIFDSLLAGTQLPTWPERNFAMQSFNAELSQREELISPGRLAASVFSRQTRSDFVSDVFVALLLPVTTVVMSVEDRANTLLSLTQLAAAISQYKAEHGEYPDSLESLVPEILDELPVDLFHENSFVYQRTVNGYLFYSLGGNAQDDKGSSDQLELFHGYGSRLSFESLREVLGDELPLVEDYSIELDPDAEEPPMRPFAAGDSLKEQIPEDADDIAIRVPLPKLELPKGK